MAMWPGTISFEGWMASQDPPVSMAQLHDKQPFQELRKRMEAKEVAVAEKLEETEGTIVECMATAKLTGLVKVRMPRCGCDGSCLKDKVKKEKKKDKKKTK